MLQIFHKVHQDKNVNHSSFPKSDANRASSIFSGENCSMTRATMEKQTNSAACLMSRKAARKQDELLHRRFNSKSSAESRKQAERN